MDGNDQRFVAQRRENGKYWRVVDRKTGAPLVTSDSSLDSLSEEEAKHIADALNRGGQVR